MDDEDDADLLAAMDLVTEVTPMDTEETNTPNTEDSETQSGVQKKKLTLSFEDYKTISNMVVLHMRVLENNAESDDSESEGIRRSDIISWYLETVVADQIETEEELIERKTLIEKIVDRLIYHVSFLKFLKSFSLFLNFKFVFLRIKF